MGILGLSKPLKSYAVSTTVGCKTPFCTEHKPTHNESSRNIIIDGPSFAYSIYHRLTIQKSEWLTAVEAMPSYKELGQGAIAFLDELDDYGLKGKYIYFDGYLPPRKRNVRLDRLQRSLQKMSGHYAASQKVRHCKEGWVGRPLQTVSALRDLPPATFVVPAVLEALGTSRYAAITRVVPGEAEVYCATVARRESGVILSNDSDLFVLDIGEGAFVYLDSIELRASETKNRTHDSGHCKTVSLEMFRSPDVAQRLGVKTLGELAFQFTQRHSYTLLEAIKATKESRDIEKEDTYSKFIQEFDTEAFVSEHQQFSSQAQARLHAHACFLDPRISELICQLESKPSDAARVYLHVLIEDPTRSSAWSIASDHRSFIYSVSTLYLTHMSSSPPISIQECQRRGQNFILHPIDLLSHHDTLSFARTLRTHIHLFNTTFRTLPLTLAYRNYALSSIYVWHLTACKPPPSLDLLRRALTGAYTPHPTWKDVHLEAQIQAVLYSLRMIKQILQYITETVKEPLPGELSGLAVQLRQLPALAILMPSPWELGKLVEGMDVEGVMKGLAFLLQEEVGDEEEMGRVVRESFMGMVDGAGSPSPSIVGKRKKKRKKRGKVESEGVNNGDGNNLFQVLA